MFSKCLVLDVVHVWKVFYVIVSMKTKKNKMFIVALRTDHVYFASQWGVYVDDVLFLKF
jgi:hypothetical protein